MSLQEGERSLKEFCKTPTKVFYMPFHSETRRRSLVRALRMLKVCTTLFGQRLGHHRRRVVSKRIVSQGHETVLQLTVRHYCEVCEYT